MSALRRLGPFLREGGRRFLEGPSERTADCGIGAVRYAGSGVHIQPRYRQYPQLTKSQVFQAELLSATMWFWILWRFWHDSDAVLGHFPYPDPSQWTDEELGIPPDDED
ncbi:NADH dehydrogenase [ubiquinone] 1 beta subcomplex subunit 2, mitochondrial isoform X1 [Vombatus ursinus]|uniref:NADH dehydrogenase [ubiquinone] 1 beta subcomplex subunit 2, mitochondrial n=1 Tax=Vombatus ursinus TaxID=29139 RepID=A0A4X2LAR2_VOMUR|nr:NADH dehydrogenase [ubiquinone] 1 beta subcomplex subunit 2, mitochondrial isoform X1 [Vombatus ursinus]XP_027698175.1 NADH dehydrogenase [ubiquinone] 1 beta subcomplex subunit 2, mitochondrial isoform X1 [Vombatus ursinus]